MDLRLIQEAIGQGKIFFTDHAVRQMIVRDIMDSEAIEAVLAGEIV